MVSTEAPQYCSISGSCDGSTTRGRAVTMLLSVHAPNVLSLMFRGKNICISSAEMSTKHLGMMRVVLGNITYIIKEILKGLIYLEMSRVSHNDIKGVHSGIHTHHTTHAHTFISSNPVAANTFRGLSGQCIKLVPPSYKYLSLIDAPAICPAVTILYTL